MSKGIQESFLDFIRSLGRILLYKDFPLCHSNADEQDQGKGNFFLLGILASADILIGTQNSEELSPASRRR